MKILIYSPMFYPSIGGLETIMLTLAEEFVKLGNEVRVLTKTNSQDCNKFPFEIIRHPSPWETIKLTQWCDVFFQGCVSLKGLWSVIIISRPLLVTHQTWYQRSDGSQNWQDHLKRLVSRFAINIAPSKAVAEDLPVMATIIPNSYNSEMFYEMIDLNRTQELVFLGRLVSDKGVSLLIESIKNLKVAGLNPNLTIIGDGVEKEALQQLTKDYNIEAQVNFIGKKTGKELVKELNKHRIMVVPSLWNEPFGIVALEGIACGCVVVGSEGGGLKDAIGDCGLTFPNGDVNALTDTLALMLQNPSLLDKYRKNAPAHLDRHKKEKIAQAYLEVIEKAVRK